VSATVLPWLVAIIVGAIVSFLDLATGRKKSLYKSAWFAITIRLVYDMAASMIALSPLRLISTHPLTWPGVGLAATGGLLGPLLMRTKADFAFKNRQFSFNALGMLRRLQEKADRQIDELCAVEESNWINYKVLPAVAHLTVDEVATWSAQALKSLERPPAEELLLTQAIATIEAERTSSISTEEGMRFIVQVLADYGGHKLINGLMQRAAAPDQSPTGSGHTPSLPSP
jgi:hypothetical protein